MKARYLVLATMFILVLTGCKNRFEEFEPYSAFDDRMAEAVNDGSMTADGRDFGGQYASDSGGVDRGYYNDDGFNNSYERPSRAPARQYSTSSHSTSSGSNGEVPFSDSRGPKHATNIGASID